MSPNGTCVWRRPREVTKLGVPGRAAVAETGAIFISDMADSYIRELTKDGHHSRDIGTADITPYALCSTRTGSLLFVCELSSSDIYVMRPGDGQPRKALQAVGIVKSLSLQGDDFLGVATQKGLELYDVSRLIMSLV